MSQLSLFSDYKNPLSLFLAPHQRLTLTILVMGYTFQGVAVVQAEIVSWLDRNLFGGLRYKC